MLKRLVNFIADDSAAVTVDWVVLTAVVVGLGIAVMTSVAGGATQLAETTEDSLVNVGVHLENGWTLHP